MAIKVKLRQKSISKDRQSLYLDFYPAIIDPKTGNPTRREFLNAYLFNEIELEQRNISDTKGNITKRYVPVLDRKGNPRKVRLSPLDKAHNENTLQRAEQIRQKRENDVNKPEIYSNFEKEQLKLKEQGEKNFVEYFKMLADKRIDNNHDNWISCYKYLKEFSNGIIKFANLNEKICNEFKEYLLTTQSNKSSKTKLAQNSAVSYFNKFKAALRQAYKDGYLGNDLNARIDTIKAAETHRNFLTIEELNSLITTECQNLLLKRAALFSALTGLRFSDIAKLTWGEIEYIEGSGYFIKFTQQKTKGVEMLPISQQAYELAGQPGEPHDRIFDGLSYSAYSNKHLYQWIGAAGITKDITFHSFRHTHATLLLTEGIDIYTVSKMLGHRELKTTQIYAQIIDKTKREAAEKIKLNF
jgi:integrase